MLGLVQLLSLHMVGALFAPKNGAEICLEKLNEGLPINT